MINILIPMAGNNTFEGAEFAYPKPLMEVGNKPLIHHVVEFLTTAQRTSRFTFLVNEGDCHKFHLDSVLALISPTARVLKISNPTKGAACTCLLAIDDIELDQPLLISSSDHYLVAGLSEALDSFEEQKADAGVVCFESIHPKWSYVKLNDRNDIVEAAEKNPLSHFAIAGLYYFREARLFFNSAMRMIEKDASVNDVFYVAPVLNEMILAGQVVKMYQTPPNAYFNFYSPHKFSEFEAHLSRSQ